MLTFALFVFLACLTIVLGAYGYFALEQRQVRRRLQDIEKDYPVNHVEEDQAPSRFGRMAVNVSDKVLQIARPRSNDMKMDKLEQKLYRAGLMPEVGPNRWILLRVLTMVIIPLLLIILSYRLTESPLRSMMVGGLVSLMTFAFMGLLLASKIKGRQKDIGSALPDALDLITVSVEAGLSFDGAMDRVAQNMEGPLSSEFGQTLKELRMGKSRREAMRAMSNRCDVPDLTAFIGAVTQADELGVSVGSILRIQSVQMRERRRQRAREKSMQAPIKMMFPLVLFIFPTIFVVLLGPAMIQMAETFVK